LAIEPAAAPPRATPSERGAIGIVQAMLAVAAFALLLAIGAVLGGWHLGFGPLGIAALLAGTCALALGAAAWAGRRIAAPIEALTKQAEALRELDVSVAAQPPSGVAEIDRLGAAMRQMKQALGLFGIYVPRDLVRQIVSRSAEVKLGGERRAVTVMFTDVQDFTAIAEHQDPEELMRITSAYFEALTSELLRNQATIDKYIGDAVMALWNAPRRDLAHAMHACSGALRARHLTERLGEDFRARGWPVLRTRFGVHSGEAVVGNVGSSDRMSYTAIGSVVNLASRLEGLNKHYGTQVLVSEATMRGAGHAFVFRPVDMVVPKGTQEPVEIHELVGLIAAHDKADAPLVADPAIVASLPAWREMILCYRAGLFDAAEDALRRAARPATDALAATYAARIARLRAEPPGPDWSAAIRFAEK
jgi:adenylate cyclase